jgi:hypothetical protein
LYKSRRLCESKEFIVRETGTLTSVVSESSIEPLLQQSIGSSSISILSRRDEELECSVVLSLVSVLIVSGFFAALFHKDRI